MSDADGTDWKRRYSVKGSYSAQMVSQILTMLLAAGWLVLDVLQANTMLFSPAMELFGAAALLCGASYRALSTVCVELVLTQDSIGLVGPFQERTLKIKDIAGYHRGASVWGRSWDKLFIVPTDPSSPEMLIGNQYETDGDLEHWISYLQNVEGMIIAERVQELDQTNRD